MYLLRRFIPNVNEYLDYGYYYNGFIFRKTGFELV